MPAIAKISCYLKLLFFIGRRGGLIFSCHKVLKRWIELKLENWLY
jgi:hypothetical protein